MKHLLLLLGLWLLPALAVAQEEPAGIWELAWSPDGERLAIADLNGTVYILSMPDESIQALSGHSNRVWTVAWSPDSQWLASGGLIDRFVYLWDVPTGTLSQRIYPSNYESGIILDPGVGQIAWSPNGTYLLATSFDTFQFWEATSWTALEPSRGGTLYDAEWSPDGSLLAVTDIYYLSFFNGQTLITDDLENDVIRSEGDNPEQLSWSRDSQLLATTDRLDPRVSVWNVPARTRIGELNTTGPLFTDVVFIGSDRIAAITETGTLYLLDTTASVLATFETGVTEARSLAWNPQRHLFAVGGAQTVVDENGISGLPLISLDDVLPSTVPSITPPPVPRGQVLYMAETEDERSALFLYDFDSDTEQQITDGSFYIGSPQLSPQGDWIVFHSDIGGNRDLYLMRPDGSELHALTSSAGADLFPVWSPDGNWIVYDYGIEQGYAEIYVIHRGGGDPVRVTTTGGARPDWSPDGERIAFIWRDAEDVFQIYTVRIDGSDRVQLTFGDEAANYPKWSPDSNWIAFNGDIGHNYYIQADGIGGPQRIPNLYTDSKLEWVNEDTLAYTQPGYASVFTIKVDGTGITELEMPFLWQANNVSLSGLKVSP